MRLLANENIPRASVLHLRELGYEVYAIGEDNSGISDMEVLTIAIAHERLIVTSTGTTAS